MTFQIRKVFIILCSLISVMTSPSTIENNEEASSSTIDIESQNVYNELKKIYNQLIVKYPSKKDKLSAKYTKLYTDSMIVRAMILNDNDLIKQILNECKKLGDNLDFIKYGTIVKDIMEERLKDPLSLHCYLNNDEILMKIFEYYSNYSKYVSMSVFLDFLKNERLLEENELYNNIVDQLNLQNFSEMMKPHLRRYLDNMGIVPDARFFK
ncbi:uncharacterized protein LOC126894435 [Daktulosphaira vitifoliae]|uniref:uncharacterized protein LOC126894435 n=1 Tax=Daktulosphaira vitifoliae TaxID=58002 RepID=UPI0021AA10C7|nr:uncharacterized protein LOC126894435 [Daktulosphaira vitifoliae]